MSTIVSRWFAQPFVHAQIKENIEAPSHWLLRGEFTVDLWFPHKGLVTRKMLPFDDVIVKNLIVSCIPHIGFKMFCFWQAETITGPNRWMDSEIKVTDITIMEIPQISDYVGRGIRVSHTHAFRAFSLKITHCFLNHALNANIQPL